MHRFIRHSLLTLATLVALFVLAPASAQAASSLGCADTTSGTTDLDYTAAILADTNAHRASVGLPALVLDPSLSKASTWKARDMARRNYFSHDDQAPAGSGEAARSPWDRLKDCGYDKNAYKAENIAAGQTSGSAFVTAWINSQGHRENIENPNMRYIGIGSARSETSTYKTYSVQMFSSVAGDLAGATPAIAVAPPTTTKLTLLASSADYDLCPPASPAGISYRDDSSSGITVTTTAKGCLHLTAPGAGTATVVYRAWNAGGTSSTPVTLTVLVTADRTLAGLDGDEATDAAPTAARSVLKGATAVVTKARCRGRWAVAGFCYTLTSRATLVRPNGSPLVGQPVFATRRTVTGRSATLGSAKTARGGVVTVRTLLKPPATGTRAWLLRTAHTVQLQYRGSAALLPSSAVATTRVR